MEDAGVAAACVEGECVFFFGDDDFFGWVGFKEGDARGEADYAGAEDEDVALLWDGVTLLGGVIAEYDWAGGWVCRGWVGELMHLDKQRSISNVTSSAILC